MPLRLVCHGGLCCGIKTIYGFTGRPKTDFCGDKQKTKFVDNDEFGLQVNSDLDFFHLAAPKETYVKRLDRLINYCEKRRPNGIIEAVLVDAIWCFGNQLTTWRPYLRRRGFRQVNSCLNSNSGNVIHVFHRNSGEVKKEKKVKKTCQTVG